MNTIAVTAEFHFKSDHLDAALAIIQSIIKPSREETGCLFYEFYKDDKQDNTYVMIERWTNHKDWQRHLQSQHISQAAQAIQSFLSTPILVRSFSEVK